MLKPPPRMEQTVALLDSAENGRINEDTYVKSSKSKYAGSLYKLVGINALVCGVEIVSSAGFTYIPPLLLKAGFTETSMTIILGIGKKIKFFTKIFFYF